MTVTTQHREGQYTLIQFDITFPNGRIESLAPICSTADIYESVLEPTVMAEIVITDKKGIFEALDFTEQKITIEFTTYQDNEEASVKYELFPQLVTRAAPLPDGKGVVYKLVCVSEEAKKAPKILNLSLTRSNIECERMIAALLQDPESLNSQKNLFMEKTQGLHGFNFTLINPFAAIEKVRLKALSADFTGHCFVFYENSKGYHFKSLEGLVQSGKASIGDKYYVRTAAADADMAGARWRNILALEIVQAGNQNFARMVGATNVLVKLINTVTWEETRINLDQRYLNFVQLNDNAISSSLRAQNELSSGFREEEVAFNPEVETADVGLARAIRPYYLRHLFNTIVQITVYGDSTVTVGNVIAARIPEMNALTLGQERPYTDTSSTLAGNYLVTKCRHALTFGEGAQYFQALEIVKDGYAGDAPTTGDFIAAQ